MSKTGFSDLFDFSDNKEIQKAIDSIKKLNSEHERLISNVGKGKAKFTESIKNEANAVDKLTGELKGLDAQREDNQKTIIKSSKAVDASAKKVDELNKALKGADQIEKQFGNSVEAMNAKLKAQVKAFNLVDQSTKSGADTAKKLGNEIRKTKEEIKDITAVTRTQNNVFERVEGSYNSLTKANNKLKAELRALPNSFDKANQKAEDLRKQISKNTQELKEWDAAIGDNFRNVGDYGGALDGLTDKFAGLIGGGGAGGIGGAVSGIGGMVPQLAAAGAVVGLVGEGISELNELAKELRVQFKAVSDTLGLVGEEGEAATVGIRATASTFDQEFNEVLRASNTLMETFGISSEEALEAINTGFITGANSNEELLDSIKEYPVFFRDAGLGAEHLVEVIRSSADAGIFSDKGVDAVKEFNLRIKENTKATSEALLPLGKLRNEQIQLAVESGKVGDAMGIITEGMQDVDLSAQQLQTIVADVFGGPGEDVGMDYLFTLGEIISKTDEETRALTDLQKAQLEVLQVNQEFEASLVEMGSRFTGLSQQSETLWTRIKTFGVDTLIAVFDAVMPLIDAFGEMWQSLKKVLSVFSFLNKTGDETSLLFKAIGFSIKLTLLPLTGLVKALTWVYDAFNRFIVQTAPIQKALGFIEVGFEKLVDAIKKVPRVMNGLINAFKVGFSELKGLVLEQGEVIQDAFFAIFDPTKSVKDVLSRSTAAFKDYGQKIKQAFLDGYNQIEDPTFKVLSESREAPKKKEAAAVVTVAGKKAKKEKEKELNDLQSIIDAHEKRRLARAKEAIKNRLNANKTESNLLVAQLQKRYNDGEISKKNFEAAKQAIEKQYNDLSLKNEEDALNNLISLNMVKGSDLVAVKKRLSEIELAQNKVKTEKVEENEKGLFEKITEYAQQSFDALMDFASKLVENSIQNSEFKLEQLEFERQRDVELAGDNEEQIRLINEKAESQRIALEDKRRKDQVRQAKLDKANAMVSIAINTAVAISKVIGQTGIFGLAAWIPVAALGALQLAAVASQPIPAFAKGTTNAPSGYAIVAEEGPEAIKSKGGSIEIAHTPQVKKLKGGETIYTAKQTRSLALSALDSQNETLGAQADVYINNQKAIEEQAQNRSFENELMKRIAGGQKEVIKAVSEMERFSFEGTARGMRAFAKNAKGRTELLNNRYG